MTTILTEVGLPDNEISMTFKAGGTIPMNMPVKLSAAGVVILGDGDDSIGWAVPNDAVEALNDEVESYLVDQLVWVKMKGEVLNVTSSAAIAVGDFTLGAAAGKYAPETVATTKTAFTEGIALDAAAGADAIIRMVRF